ncbi:hypothetical protein WICANDRAFT_85250 [Wickerhamomyces anomalus NRRL Y-366-8]|uniref:Major facilitator superfamily (MFS) profile domain-containing protein n=1 Tax=Wickerhamomyces anomalus (strain ATCC 58044 / CBS 1984 / NCYC 433 / NRRL Y-366-8) TaxID=683960 RepID=A0A1E3NYE5_WICAA|nr:uncharacterized protein WICANDRAFT_85250 [Wickerhamomyces anomalus NRRL Y-366-8]ODQ58133.1 hypothetical protein WICANDRAFT_85250 [Wickerhamomyces anomalus NRRL Y-366-8]
MSNTDKEKFFESNAGDGTTVYDQYLHGFPLYMCLGSCFASLFLIGLDQTIVITILEEVGNKFNGYDKMGWISAGYMLTMAVFAATWGKMSIIFGRKWSLLLAIVLFEAGSLMCALANDMDVLIGGRILAGIGGGGIQTLVFIVCSELTPIHQRPLVFVVLSLSFACSTVTGPLIGGAFSKHVTWRWCFYINLPIGGLALGLLTIFFNPPRVKGSMREKLKLIDYPGTFLLTSGVVIFLLALTFGALTFGGVEFAWNSGAIISMFIIGGVLLILFCVWNFEYSKNPIIPLSIVKVRQVVLPVLTLALVFFSFMSVVIFLTTYFQLIFGMTAWQTGVRTLPVIVPLVIASIASGILIKKTRYIKPYSVFGGVCGSVGIGLLLLLDIDTSGSAKIGLLIIPGIYCGICLQTCMISSQLHAPKEAGSTILTTSFINFSRSIGGTLGADLSQAIFNASYKNRITKALKSYPNGTLGGLNGHDASKLIASPGLIRNLDPEVKKVVLKAIMKSIRNVFIVTTTMAVVSFVVILFFSNKRLPKEEDVQQTKDDNGLDNALSTTGESFELKTKTNERASDTK